MKNLTSNDEIEEGKKLAYEKPTAKRFIFDVVVLSDASAAGATALFNPTNFLDED